jgi:hypothetical protein
MLAEFDRTSMDFTVGGPTDDGGMPVGPTTYVSGWLEEDGVVSTLDSGEMPPETKTTIARLTVVDLENASPVVKARIQNGGY